MSMKRFRTLFAILLLLFVADIARYLVYPDVGRLVEENPAKTAFMESREAQWQREGLNDKKIQLLIKFCNRFGYEVNSRINYQIDQRLFCLKLPSQNLEGINRCELKLFHPASPHQPIRLHNISIQF